MEDEESPEAKFVVQFDKFEAVLQAYFYKKEGAGMVDYLSFIELSESKFFDQGILDLIEELKRK
jgi:5'-deoxynucleotidase YfbR-like HD superfamily hydrolase